MKVLRRYYSEKEDKEGEETTLTDELLNDGIVSGLTSAGLGTGLVLGSKSLKKKILDQKNKEALKKANLNLDVILEDCEKAKKAGIPTAIIGSGVALGSYLAKRHRNKKKNKGN